MSKKTRDFRTSESLWLLEEIEKERDLLVKNICKKGPTNKAKKAVSYFSTHHTRVQFNINLQELDSLIYFYFIDCIIIQILDTGTLRSRPWTSLHSIQAQMGQTSSVLCEISRGCQLSNFCCCQSATLSRMQYCRQIYII